MRTYVGACCPECGEVACAECPLINQTYFPMDPTPTREELAKALERCAEYIKQVDDDYDLNDTYIQARALLARVNA
jgi:hypothetical protein